MSRKNMSVALLALSLSIFAIGCKPKATPSTTTPPAPTPTAAAPSRPAAAVRSFTVEPSTITAGQSATLRWAIENADSVTISGLGTVQLSGSQSVSPSSTTTYRLTASGAGGNADRSVTLTVRPSPPPDTRSTVSAPTGDMSLGGMVNRMLSDVLFDYDKSEVRSDVQPTLNKNAEALKTILGMHSNAIITVEGHCDERGSAEYNLGLGDRRSTTVKDYLVNLGVPGDRLKVISYGNEKPACQGDSESCHQQNRRAHFSVN